MSEVSSMSADERHENCALDDQCAECARERSPRDRERAELSVPPSVRTVRAMRNRRRVIE